MLPRFDAMETNPLTKALEIWSLETLLNTSIALGLVAFGLMLVQRYLQSLREEFSLRVSIEVWNLAIGVAVDVILAFIVLGGFLVLNPDTMADMRMAIPFVPVATILFAIALIVRLFYGGHRALTRGFIKSLWLMLFANVINILGYSIGYALSEKSCIPLKCLIVKR